MQVLEKKRHIDVLVQGIGLEAIRTAIIQAIPVS